MKSHKSKHSVFVVDDEPKVCQAICETLDNSDMKVTCFNSAAECLEQLRGNKCDLLITDLRMPQMDGFELLKNVRALAPWLPVLVITGYGDVPMAVKTIKAGAVDFIEKPLIKDDFLRRVNLLLEESMLLNPYTGTSLTKAESHILQLIVTGKSNRQIADLLHRSVRTIEVHRSRIMDKLGAENLIDLFKKAATMGLIDLPAEQYPGETRQDVE